MSYVNFVISAIILRSHSYFICCTSESWCAVRDLYYKKSSCKVSSEVSSVSDLQNALTQENTRDFGPINLRVRTVN